MSKTGWQKSSFCSGGGNNCVELATAGPGGRDGDGIAMREGADPGQVIVARRAAVRSLLGALKAEGSRRQPGR